MPLQKHDFWIRVIDVQFKFNEELQTKSMLDLTNVDSVNTSRGARPPPGARVVLSEILYL